VRDLTVHKTVVYSETFVDVVVEYFVGHRTIANFIIIIIYFAQDTIKPSNMTIYEQDRQGYNLQLPIETKNKSRQTLYYESRKTDE